MFIFNEDKQLIWAMGVVFFKPSIVRLRELSVRFHLNWVLWHPKILSNLGHLIGVPLNFDHNTIVDEFGHYAQFLVTLLCIFWIHCCLIKLEVIIL